jgi:hypothetical protein
MELFSLRKIRRICPQHRGPGPPAPAHGSTDFIKCRLLASGSMARIESIKPVSRLLIWRLRCLAPTGDGAGSHSRRHVTVECGDSPEFEMRFAPTGSQRWGERVYANLNRRRVATKPDNGEVARSVLVDGEGGLPWSFGSKDVHQGFLELPSSFSTDQLLRLMAENSNFVAT